MDSKDNNDHKDSKGNNAGILSSNSRARIRSNSRG
jgi:hypothetical protein